MIIRLTELWMRFKRRRSADSAKAERAPLPQLTTPQQIADYVRQHVIYTGDRLGGLDDRYTHPEVIAYHAALNAERAQTGAMKVWPLRLDCDDVSALAYKAALGLPGLRSARMLVYRYPTIKDVLADAWGQIKQGKRPYLYFHEACLIDTDSGIFLIDPSGCREVADGEEATGVISAKFKRNLVPQPVPYPFED